MFKLIDLMLPDVLWLETLVDIEELGAPQDLLALQLKCRPHLRLEKRALGLEHLKQIN